MTLSEFKAWFEGYMEHISGAPSQEQFDRIRARIAEIEAVKPIQQFIPNGQAAYPYRPNVTNNLPYATALQNSGVN